MDAVALNPVIDPSPKVTCSFPTGNDDDLRKHLGLGWHSMFSGGNMRIYLLENHGS